MDKICKFSINSPIWKALSPEQYTLMMIFFVRTAKARVAFWHSSHKFWERNGIRLDTKLKVYKVVILPTLLNACEIWTVYQWHAKGLNIFHYRCLRNLLKIRWQDKTPDAEVLKKARMQSVHTLVKMDWPHYSHE